MGCPVEIEFAVRLKETITKKPEFHLLQIRPLIAEYEIKDIEINKEDTRNIIYSNIALGNGTLHDIEDIILVRPEHFDNLKAFLIADEIALFNKKLHLQKKPYILIGPGRWGSSDHMLCIPVKWNDISAVKVIVEIGLPDYNIEPSYGTHFFQNLISLQIIYLTIPYKNTDSLSTNYIAWNWINGQNIVDQTHYVLHIHVNNP